MLTKIKLWLSVAGAALIAGLFAMLKIKSAKLDKAETDVDKLAEINKQNKKVRKVDDEIQQAKDYVDSASDDVVRDSLQQYDRSRKDSD